MGGERRAIIVRELEASLQRFGDFLLKAQLVTETAAPDRWSLVGELMAAEPLEPVGVRSFAVLVTIYRMRQRR